MITCNIEDCLKVNDLEIIIKGSTYRTRIGYGRKPEIINTFTGRIHTNPKRVICSLDNDNARKVANALQEELDIAQEQVKTLTTTIRKLTYG